MSHPLERWSKEQIRASLSDLYPITSDPIQNQITELQKKEVLHLLSIDFLKNQITMLSHQIQDLSNDTRILSNEIQDLKNKIDSGHVS